MINKKKNILVIYLGSRGGGVLDTYNICKHLFKIDDHNYSLLISESNQKLKSFEDSFQKRLFVVKTYKHSKIDFVIRTVSFIRIMSIIQILRNLKPEIVIFIMLHPWLVFILTYLKIFMKNSRTIYIKHNPSIFENLPSKIINTFLNACDRFLTCKSDYIFTLSESVKQETLVTYNLPLEKVFSFNFGAHRFVCNGWKHKGFYKNGILRLLFFGNILEYKGIDILVDSYEIMKKENLPVQLVIAGDGPINKVLKMKADKLGIKLLNYWISDEELCGLLSETDIIILPYKKASQSGPASIATSLGIPVIASRVGGLTEQVIDGVNGFLIEPCAQDIVNAVKKILLNPSLLDHLSNGAKLLSETKFSWENIAKKMNKVLNEIIIKDNFAESKKT
jgi:glycosyltransferase involved in cell wall biosynthesis